MSDSIGNSITKRTYAVELLVGRKSRDREEPRLITRNEGLQTSDAARDNQMRALPINHRRHVRFRANDVGLMLASVCNRRSTSQSFSLESYSNFVGSGYSPLAENTGEL